MNILAFWGIVVPLVQVTVIEEMQDCSLVASQSFLQLCLHFSVMHYNNKHKEKFVILGLGRVRVSGPADILVGI